MIGSAIAALFLSHLVQVVLTLGAPTFSQLLIEAGAIAAATVMGTVSWRGIRSRSRRRSSASMPLSGEGARCRKGVPLPSNPVLPPRESIFTQATGPSDHPPDL